MTYRTYNRRNRRNKRITRKLKNMFSGMLLLVCMVQLVFLSLFACYHQFGFNQLFNASFYDFSMVSLIVTCILVITCLIDES